MLAQQVGDRGDRAQRRRLGAGEVGQLDDGGDEALTPARWVLLQLAAWALAALFVTGASLYGTTG